MGSNSSKCSINTLRGAEERGKGGEGQVVQVGPYTSCCATAAQLLSNHLRQPTTAAGLGDRRWVGGTAAQQLHNGFSTAPGCPVALRGTLCWPPLTTVHLLPAVPNCCILIPLIIFSECFQRGPYCHPTAADRCSQAAATNCWLCTAAIWTAPCCSPVEKPLVASLQAGEVVEFV